MPIVYDNNITYYVHIEGKHLFFTIIFIGINYIQNPSANDFNNVHNNTYIYNETVVNMYNV